MDFIGDHHRISLNSPLYRVLFAVASPKLVLRRAASTWARIYEGITLKISFGEKKSASMVLTFPAHLVFPEALRTWNEAFTYTLGLAGGKHARVEIGKQTSTSAAFQGHWK